jgi:hypothetical protein
MTHQQRQFVWLLLAFTTALLIRDLAGILL